MKFSLALIVSLFYFLPVTAQVNLSVKWQQYTPPANSDTIYYTNTKKLIWPDFKGSVDKKSDATAITSSGFGYNAGVKYKNGIADIDITVYCYFSKPGSWVIKGKETDYALNHEQHHFDVSYIVTNNFINKLKAAKFTFKNYNTLLDKIYLETRQELEKMQNEYDGQTRNGRVPAAQAEWNSKIEKQLVLISK